MSRMLAIALFSAWGMMCSGQELSLEVKPNTLKVLPGEPMEFTVFIRSTSEKPLTLLGASETEAIRPECRLWKGSERYWESTMHEGIAGERLPVSKQAKYEIPAFTQLVMRAGIYGHVMLPLDSIKPGHYSGKLAVTYDLYLGGEISARRIIELEMPVEVIEPQGADAAYLQALRDAASKADPKEIRGPGFSTKPLRWAEVLQSWRLPSQEIVRGFPTSTYAGYALLTSRATFGCGSYDCFAEADSVLRKECSRGGGESDIVACMERERKLMREYIQAAEPFLGAHPDFFEAPCIRRYYAYCLAFTGHLGEAIEQVSILAKGGGELAIEAKTFLDMRCKEGNKKAKPASK